MTTLDEGGDEMEIGEFHHTDGWTFRRMDDGFVRIRKRSDDTESRVEAEHVIDEASWASIVAHVSAAGESGDSFEEARRFHAGYSLFKDMRDLAQIAAAVFPDGSMRLRATLGRIAAESFSVLYGFAARVDAPHSVWDEETPAHAE